MTRAVIDIGSNSVRLMIDRGLRLNPKKLATTRLGGGLNLTGAIDCKAFDDSIKAVAEFYREAVEAGAAGFIFATEAVRAASNGRQFCDEIKRVTGSETDVINGSTEALIAYIGAADDRGDYTVIDSGGASTEITVGRDGRVLRSVSIKTGSVRLKSLGPDVCTAQYIDGLLADVPSPRGKVVAVGGTATALAAADLRLPTYDPFKIHGHIVTADALARLIGEFAEGDITARFPAVTPSRAEILPYGALLYQRLVARMSIDGFTVSETDNCEGYLKYLDLCRRNG